MDKKTYLARKKAREESQKQTNKSRRQRCLKCRRPLKTCLCSRIEPIVTQTAFTLLLHPKEARKQKLGTGRISHLYLTNSRIIEGVDFTENSEVNNLIQNPEFFPVVLYPGDQSYNISKGKFPRFESNNKSLMVFVLDGTWAQAKKMMRLSRNLQNLPRISLTPPQRSRFFIKTQPHEKSVSTIEAVYYLLVALKEIGLEGRGHSFSLLMDMLETLCSIQERCATNPNLNGYRKKTFKTPPRRVSPVKSSRRSFYHKQ